MYDVITIGSATVDVFAYAESELIKIKSEHHTEELIAYPMGSKILIKHLEFFTGGGGTNTACCLAKLGHKVGYIGKIGNEENSNLVLSDLKKYGVVFLGAREKGVCGYSVILMGQTHDRSILAYKGLNNNLLFNELKLNKLKTKWFYFSAMMEESFTTLELLTEFAIKNNIKIAFNPSNYLAKKGSDYLKNIISKTELLVLNKEEAELLVGAGDFPYLIKKLQLLGPKIVVVTDGRHGAYTSNKKILYKIVPSSIKPLETTGAGDCFAASFLSGIIKQNPVEECLRVAQANAESVIQYYGAKNKLLSNMEALASTRKYKFEVKKAKLSN
ncbi:MAG: carbohydrate kinase family protein [archaeon]